MVDNSTKVTLEIPLGKAVNFTDVKESQLSFLMAGNGAVNRRSGLESIDIFTVMEDMTPSEIRAFNIVRKNVSWETDIETGEHFTLGIAYLPTSYFESTTDRRVFQKGITLLKEKDLIKKTGRNNYMLNPFAILPTRINTAINWWEAY